MVRPSSQPEQRGKPKQRPFALLPKDPSLDIFRPETAPDRIQVTKERDLSRKKNYCKSEDVTDNGAKNRDIHVSGRITNDGLDTLHSAIETGEVYTLISSTWSGEVNLKMVEVEGPDGWWPKMNTMLWSYRMDLVSTGEDEDDGGSSSENGIISDGNTAQEPGIPGP